MSDEWIGLVHQASPKWTKKIVDLTVRKQIVLSLMEKAGNIKLGVDTSYEENYPIDWKDAPVSTLGFGGGATYEPRDYTKTATIEWRGYLATDMMHVKEQSLLRGSSARFVNRYARIIPKKLKGMRKKFGTEFYIDGNASGNQDRFCGIESFCGTDGQTPLVADLIAAPNDTYNGIDTDLGANGDWTSALTTSPSTVDVAKDWPEGTGDTEYDYWSPKLVNTTSTAWPSGSSNEWYDTGGYVLRRTAQWLRQTAGVESDTLLALLNGSLMTDFKNAQEAKLRTLAQHPQARDLGFPGDLMEYDGMMLKTEYGVPVNTGYVLNMDEVELDILDSEFITTRGPLLDPDTLAYKWFGYTFGNFKFVPKFCAKLYPYASA